jgi:signal transduction histidine kinase
MPIVNAEFEVELPVSAGGLLPLLGQRIRASSPATQRAVRVAFLWVVVVVAIAIVDAVTGSPGQEPFRLVAMVLAAVGFFLRALSTMIWRVSADVAASHEQSEPVGLSRAIHAAPELNAIAAVLFGIAAGLFAPSVVAFPFFALVALVFLALSIGSAREVIHVARQLYDRTVDLTIAGERDRAAASAARLTALQSQMNPHFLFNALNTVASLVRTDQKRAERLVESLAGIFRRTLDRSAASVGTVCDEIEFVRLYLNVEQERWGTALSVEWHIDEGAAELQIPVMTLQPLVENALLHGIGQRIEGGRISVVVRHDSGFLSVAVSDNGPGPHKDFEESTGLGNLRSRLRELYGSEATLALKREEHLTTAVVRLPAKSSRGG